ncbi:MAG: oligopeptide/dipeptide ABC transporter ATP-binding protein [Halolamina sp.]|uniref:ABC transporter ATP-binding protein n=1 Tax=Halolamina sp. TaxID=1940283 RepID=UPI002FC35132
MSGDPLLQIRGLKKHFPIRQGLLKRQVNSVKAVDGVDLDVHRGEAVGLVGESGCGKTTLGKTLLRLIEPTDGEIRFDGENVASAEDARLQQLRKQVQMVYQDPDTSLNPRRTVRKTLIEPLRIHDEMENADERVNRMLNRMDLDPDTYRSRFPHELSGGQRQRVGLGRALMLEPEFLVLDEPTSALDVSVQARILKLFQELQEEMGLTLLFISHDLSVVNYLCDRTAVMYLGEIVEQGATDEVFEAPQHPYTEALFSALHPVDPDEERNRVELTGEPPSPIDPPTGCSFNPRCHRQEEVGSRCLNEVPALVDREYQGGTREMACHLYEPATDVEEDGQTATGVGDD